MSEGFAEFSASLYVQLTRGNDKFLTFGRPSQADHPILTRHQGSEAVHDWTRDPGYRLSNAKNGAAYQFLVYPKGAFILHMLRMMMFNQGSKGDALFQVMMKDW